MIFVFGLVVDVDFYVIEFKFYCLFCYFGFDVLVLLFFLGG